MGINVVTPNKCTSVQRGKLKKKFCFCPCSPLLSLVRWCEMTLTKSSAHVFMSEMNFPVTYISGVVSQLLRVNVADSSFVVLTLELGQMSEG